MGQFQFKVLCFGLTNAPATFQRAMNNVFRPLINKSVLVYIDDILVMSNTAEEHVQHLREVLELMRQHKLYAKRSNRPSKSESGPGVARSAQPEGSASLFGVGELFPAFHSQLQRYRCATDRPDQQDGCGRVRLAKV
ncbi:reverse-transcriptase [Haematococcus lacustris]|uniref:Reverse-transcriptase n=1 Tax=Haematococcus lacustris TaxID=44745 RepID=A0A6A0A8Z6_HAELA|nr:reverse-transcriptase [Haematococcus lacustris]